MLVVLVILTSSILAALFLLSFYFGYRFGLKHQDTNGVEVNEDTAKVLEGYSNFLNFGGNKWK